jgi:broad specificity phosphatase PhoE
MSVPAFHTLPEACDFYFVRHGESESNAGGRIQGHSDSPLSELGRRHAAAAAEWFADRKIDVVLSSPLSRAYDTATVIARRCGTSPPERVNELIELETGRYTGLDISELRSLDEELYARFRVHSWEAVPGAETIESLQRRGAAVWDRLIGLARSGRGRIVSVSHGGMIQWIIKATMGADGHRWMPIVKASNCGIFLLRVESTMPKDLRADDPPSAGTGYYGVWDLMNHLPY